MYNSNSANKKQYEKCTHPFYAYRRCDENGIVLQIGDNHKKTTYKRKVQVACGRKRCPNLLCRRAWALKQAAVLRMSAEDKPPTHFIVLPLAKLQPSEVWGCVTRFRRAMRYIVPKFDFYALIEEGKNEKPHIHMLVRTTAELTQSMVYDAWLDAMKLTISYNKPTGVLLDYRAVYCKPVLNVMKSCRYVPKLWLNWDAENKILTTYPIWCPDKKWDGVKIQQTTPKYLLKPFDELWHDWLIEKGIQQEIDEVKALPDWIATPNDEFNDGDEVSCSYLPSIKCQVYELNQNEKLLLKALEGQYESVENVYCLHFDLSKEQFKVLSQDIMGAIFKPTLCRPYYSMFVAKYVLNKWGIKRQVHVISDEQLERLLQGEI